MYYWVKVILRKNQPVFHSNPDTPLHTGIADEIFSNAANLSTLVYCSTINTPPRHLDIPTDLETEDSVPLGRSHHVERFLQHHDGEFLQQSPHILQPHFSSHISPLHRNSQSPNYPFNFNLPTSASPHGPPATPSVGLRACVVRHHVQSLPRSNTKNGLYHSQKQRRKVMAMVGDGINDVPVCSILIFVNHSLILLF